MVSCVLDNRPYLLEEPDLYIWRSHRMDNTLSEDRWDDCLSDQSKSVDFIAVPSLEVISKSKRLNSLMATWKTETALLSNITKKSMHPAYQQIIGMGEFAIPFLLRDFQSGKYEDWFWALTAITGENPIQPEQAGMIKAMAEAWIEWGIKRGYLSD